MIATWCQPRSCWVYAASARLSSAFIDFASDLTNSCASTTSPTMAIAAGILLTAIHGSKSFKPRSASLELPLPPSSGRHLGHDRCF